MKKQRKMLIFAVAICMVFSTFATSFAAETYDMSVAWEEETITDYTYSIKKNDPKTEMVTFAENTALDKEKADVKIGAESPDVANLLDSIKGGEMAAQKSGAFATAEDAKNGVVKITFDVVGKPVVEQKPVDLVILADESGSMNMYGRAAADKNGANYMPCLNKEHAYRFDGLQAELNEIALLRNPQAAIAETQEEDAATYLKPGDAGLENLVFKFWVNADNIATTRKMIENAALVFLMKLQMMILKWLCFQNGIALE